MNKVEQILDRATEFLSDPDHWHQGTLHNEDKTASCALGAIDRVALALGVKRHNHRWQAEQVLHQVVGEHYPHHAIWGADGDGRRVAIVDIANWNDEPDRQHSEVIAMFEKARATAAEQGV